MKITTTRIDNVDIFDLAVHIAKATKTAKDGDQIIVLTGTTDMLNNVMKICDVR